MGEPMEKITDSELEIMQALWAAGEPLPLTEIRQRVCGRTSWESSTVKTLLQRLCTKGVVTQEKREVYYYSPVIGREEYNRYAAQSLIDRLWNGSAKGFVASLVSSQGLSREDLEELREMFRVEEQDE